jgi:hypothetical protein
MESTYQTKLSTQSKILTLLLNLVIVYICYILLFRNDLLKNTNQPPESIKYLTVLILLIAFVLAYILHPTKYILTDVYLGIKKPFYTTKIALNSIENLKQIDYEDLAIRSRLFASGGIWGYFGIYNSSNFGRIYLNVSNFNSLVLIVTKSKKIIVVSPENPSDFVNKIKLNLTNS